MTRGLSDFLIKRRKELTFNTNKLKALPIEDFARLWVDEMDLFMKNHGYFSPCDDCLKPIITPGNYVRYFGANYHSDCFIRAYEIQRERLQIEDQEFFDLVKDSLRQLN